MEEITPVREEEEREEDTPSEQPATSSTADKDTPEARKDAAGAENENDAQAENELVFSIAKTKARSWTSLFYGTEAEAKVLRGRSENSAAAEAIREREEEGLVGIQDRRRRGSGRERSGGRHGRWRRRRVPRASLLPPHTGYPSKQHRCSTLVSR